MDNSSPYVNAAINSLSANIAILDEDGAILETNRSWQSSVRKNQLGSREDSIGFNYLEVCNSAQGTAAEVEKTHEAAARVGIANHEAIAAAKAGIMGLVVSASATYAKSNIRLNCVAPDWCARQ